MITNNFEAIIKLFFHCYEDSCLAEEYIWRTARIQRQFNLPFVVWNGDIFFLANDCCRALGLDAGYYAKNCIDKKKMNDLWGSHMLLKGEELKRFKQLYEQQVGTKLTHTSSLWVLAAPRMMDFMTSRALVSLFPEDLPWILDRAETIGDRATAALLRRELDNLAAAIAASPSVRQIGSMPIAPPLAAA